MGLYTGIVIVALILVIIILIVVKKVYRGKIPQINKRSFKTVLKAKQLDPDDIVFSTHNNNGNFISINKANNKFSYGYIDRNQHYSEEYDFSNIISFEVEVDEQVSHKVLADGTMTGSKTIGEETETQKAKIKNIFLIIKVNSSSASIIRFSLLTSSLSNNQDEHDKIIVQNAIEEAEKWMGIFKNIIKENHKKIL